MPKDKPHTDIQLGALPWRIAPDGVLEVLLLTSRETHRWVIPKGWPMKKMRPAEVAAQEAYEEAGVIGHIIGRRPIGDYYYPKAQKEESTLCNVRVFLLRVDRELDDWPEKQERTRQWFNPREAARLVNEGGLAEIIGNFGAYGVDLRGQGRSR